MNSVMPPSRPAAPVSEAELQAYVDRQLTPERQREIEAYLSKRPEETLRVDAYLAHKRELRTLFTPVLDEPVPQRLKRAATPRTPWYLQRLAAGIAIAVVSGAAGWGLRSIGAEPGAETLVRRTLSAVTLASAAGFAQRAAVAHAVYSPDARRSVEVGADQEDQLVAWLSKRMGAPMKPPHLQALGYALDGGRLLPGGEGPVAQFMYHDSSGQRLTLYVTREVPKQSGQPETAFRFGKDGPVNVFYWVDKGFGYAISGGSNRDELMRVSKEVYRQLGQS